MSQTASPVIFMRDERLKQEAAIEPDGVATGAVGIFATNWAGSDGAAPDGAVARLSLSF